MTTRRYNEVKRSRRKVKRAHGQTRKGPTITTTVNRTGKGRFAASACVRRPRVAWGRAGIDWHAKRCEYGIGPTPSAALAVAVARVTQKFRHY